TDRDLARAHRARRAHPARHRSEPRLAERAHRVLGAHRHRALRHPRLAALRWITGCAALRRVARLASLGRIAGLRSRMALAGVARRTPELKAAVVTSPRRGRVRCLAARTV